MNRPPLLVAALVAATSLTVLGAAALPAPARAATIAELAVELDADAAVYLAARPDAMPGVFAWLRRLPSGGPGAPLRAYADRVAASTTAVLGFDATGSWDASGLDLASPIVIGLGAFDLPAVEAAFAARDAKPGDKKALAKAPRVFVRTRLVAVVVDEGKVRGVLGRAASAGGSLALTGAPPATLGALFGGDAKLGKVVAASLKKMKAAAVWRSGAHVAFVRVGGGRLVIDAYWIFAEDGIDVKRDLPALAKLGARKLKTASPLFAGPGSAGLAEARVAALVDPVRLVDLARVGGWGNTWRAASGTPDAATARSVLDTGTKEVAQCLPFRKLAAEGPLAAFVLTARPTATGVAIDVTWPLRSAGALAAELATSDDGLVDLAAAKDAKLLALLPLADLAGLKKLGKGTIYETRAALDEASTLCGYGAMAPRILVGWLHELGDFVATNPQFGPLLADARNVALAVRTLDIRGMDPPQLVALASNVGQVRHRDLDGKGKRTAKSAGKRKLDAWIDARDARGPWVVAAPGVDPKHTIYGVVWGGDATLAWWWGQPSPAQTGGTTAFVMLVRAELPWFLGVAEALGIGRGLGDLGNGLGTLRALVTLRPDALGAALTVDVK